MKLKGIDGGPHKRRSMWFNSMIREKPYLGLNVSDRCRKVPSPQGAQNKVLHGCRQLVPWGVGLSPATSATPIFSCHQVMLGTLEKLPTQVVRKAGTTSSHHGPYAQGYTRATMDGTMRRHLVTRRKPQKAILSSDWGLQLDLMKLDSLVIGYQQWSGEYVPGPCTHRPSSHGSWERLKSVTARSGLRRY